MNKEIKKELIYLKKQIKHYKKEAKKAKKDFAKRVTYWQMEDVDYINACNKLNHYIQKYDRLSRSVKK